MINKEDKKKLIRQNIIEAAKIYSKFLAGKVFLYVYGNEYFEVHFLTNRFLHLTGVSTKLSAQAFYKNAIKSKLTEKQFYFDKKHTFQLAHKKLPCLKRLPELTNTMVCILKDMQTVSVIYKLSVTNLEFTLGLIENEKNQFYPMSLRVEDTSIQKSRDGDIVDFIFVKEEGHKMYNNILFRDDNIAIPQCIEHLINKSFY